LADPSLGRDDLSFPIGVVGVGVDPAVFPLTGGGVVFGAVFTSSLTGEASSFLISVLASSLVSVLV